jgi:thiamine-monophosphate kinase
MKRAGGVKPGHVVAVTGDFGLTSAGFLHLLQGVDLLPPVKEAALNSIYMPNARVKEGLALAETGAVTGCMDSSDGLSVSLYDMRKSTGYGFIIDELPIHPLALKFAERKGYDPLSVAMNGGEEYELLFTYPPEKERQIRAALGEVGCEPIKIGAVSEKKDIVYVHNDEHISIKKGGWDHFKE